MNIETLVIIIIALQVLVLALLLFGKKHSTDSLENEINTNVKRLEPLFKEEMAQSRRENADNQRATREELGKNVKDFGDSLDKRISSFALLQNKNFSQFSDSLSKVNQNTQKQMEDVRLTIEKKLDSIREDNTIQLDKMRSTVDEKLTETLDKRLGEKFKLVNDRLEQVYKGLGEMQNLAQGVGDLKKVLSGVKVRGTWGEVQLGSLLEQILTPEQYDTNVSTKQGSHEVVEFAIKIPDKKEKGSFLYLPIDVKFPMEDYERLIKAQETAEKETILLAQKAIQLRIKSEAKDIFDKYIDPPNTTDFGILYLPIEGLYAEVTQQIGLCEQLQREFHIVVMGPNTVAAFLNSLQIGFRTLAIEKRTSEVWNLLTTIKEEFGKFGIILTKAESQLATVQNTLKQANSKTTTISRKLTKVEQLPIGTNKEPEETENIPLLEE
ncbi:DNA recombination protein RmuC [Candidatus Dojkabacteria bacterium]|nr:DNA recombination protein RmuC [Candidatus Dojkabacteria bacterium]